MNRASIGATSFAGSKIDCPVSRASSEITVDVGRELHDELYWLFIGDGAELQLRHVLSSSVWFEHEVTIDDYPDGKTWLYS
jgi:hypothetical protein